LVVTTRAGTKATLETTVGAYVVVVPMA